MSEHNPTPWQVHSDEPYEVELQDANGRRVEGVRFWLDDADINSNWIRYKNFGEIVDAVNDRDRLAAQVETLRELLVESKFWIARAANDQALMTRIDVAITTSGETP